MPAVPLPMYGYNLPATTDSSGTSTTTTSSTTPSTSDLGTALASALTSVLDAQGRDMVTYAILNKRRLTDLDVAAFVQTHPNDDVSKNALASGEPLRKVAMQSLDPDTLLVLQQAKAARTTAAVVAFARRLPALRKRLDRGSPLYDFVNQLLSDPEFAALFSD